MNLLEPEELPMILMHTPLMVNQETSILAQIQVYILRINQLNLHSP